MNLNFESGVVGKYRGIPVFVLDESKFSNEKLKNGMLYAISHQGTNDDLSLIFYKDGSCYLCGEATCDGVFTVWNKEEWIKEAEEEEKRIVEVEEINLDFLSRNIDDFLNNF